MNFVILKKGPCYYSQRQTAWNPEYSNKVSDTIGLGKEDVKIISCIT